MHNKGILFILTLVFFVSCDAKGEYDMFKSIPKNEWKETVHFIIPVKDTITKKNLFIQIRNNKEYAFSNLFLITKMNFPNDTKVIDTLEYEMADAQGRFLGSGYTDIKENKLFYKENIVFPVKGNYEISIEQVMRKLGKKEGIHTLKGITDVGFRIEKIK